MDPQDSATSSSNLSSQSLYGTARDFPHVIGGHLLLYTRTSAQRRAARPLSRYMNLEAQETHFLKDDGSEERAVCLIGLQLRLA
jgi:hypothetical protein